MGISVNEYKMLISNELKQDPEKQLRGRTNHELGKNFELQIESICKIYEKNKLAKIEKTPEPMRVLKHIDNGHFEAIFTKVAQPDFKGIINGGRAVVFDAKFTESNKIHYQVLSDFQRETLLTYAELGALAFVLVGFSNGAIYRVDINTWNNMKAIFGRKSIMQEELDKMNLKAETKKGGIIDFLSIMK